mmetsp:Transcript_2804/g.7687  ORF Transcript_2804/g.7687 Transcript_2804/m.7687 type:complete len:87 (+) Transcript_2804:435-695(+)
MICRCFLFSFVCNKHVSQSSFGYIRSHPFPTFRTQSCSSCMTTTPETELRQMGHCLASLDWKCWSMQREQKQKWRQGIRRQFRRAS